MADWHFKWIILLLQCEFHPYQTLGSPWAREALAMEWIPRYLIRYKLWMKVSFACIPSLSQVDCLHVRREPSVGCSLSASRKTLQLSVRTKTYELAYLWNHHLSARPSYNWPRSSEVVRQTRAQAHARRAIIRAALPHGAGLKTPTKNSEWLQPAVSTSELGRL